jgi:hypothetical protein
MLTENWSSILLLSFLLVAFTNAIVASFTSVYYRKKSIGHLSHSQLRIKQGNATFEHRLNVFAQSFVFCFVTLRVYIFTVLVWLALSVGFYLKTTLGQ